MTVVDGSPGESQVSIVRISGCGWACGFVSFGSLLVLILRSNDESIRHVFDLLTVRFSTISAISFPYSPILFKLSKISLNAEISSGGRFCL